MTEGSVSQSSNTSFKEAMARFAENPTREGLRENLQSHLGENTNFDFKLIWESFPKTAKHILGFANSEGGCIIYGVNQKDDGTFEPVGLDKIVDNAVITKGVEKYLPSNLPFNIYAFSYSESEYPKINNKKFQVLIIRDNPKLLPFISMSENDKEIRKNAIYVRKGTETREASYDDLQENINRRVETAYSSKPENMLENHIAQLKVLYDHIPRYLDLFDIIHPLYLNDNPEYPEESFTEFVNKLIDAKKKTINQLIQS
jgi:predicted HTH transcriptional regulator